MKPFHRYLLFQIPGWLTVGAVMGFLSVSAGVSASLSVGVTAVVIALDFALYPFFRHSYASRAQAGPEALVGGRARVMRTLDPEGRVRIHGESWKARIVPTEQSAAEGETVEVTGVHGLMLLVRRAP